MQPEFKSLLSVIFLEVKWYGSCSHIYSKIKDNLQYYPIQQPRERGETGPAIIEPTLLIM